jgi:hypothetical protein
MATAIHRLFCTNSLIFARYVMGALDDLIASLAANAPTDPVTEVLE